MTSTKRIWSTSGATTGPIPTDRVQLVSPKGCLAGAYRLIALQGIGAEFMQRVSFVWGPVEGSSCQIQSQVVTGPFGDSNAAKPNNFNYLELSGNGTAPITAFSARSGLLVDAIQVRA